MDQGSARHPAGAVTGPTDEAAVTPEARFAGRAEAAGHRYAATPATGPLVDASCSCGGWSRWDAPARAAVVSWRLHASPSIVEHEAAEA